MTEAEAIDDFLAGTVFAVAGASTDRTKFGNKVLRAYLDHGFTAIPVNPREAEVEGQAAVASPAGLPDGVHGLSIVTPPPITEKIVDEAIARGIRRVWMQPGAESAPAIERAKKAGLSVIHGGACVLVELRRR